MGLAGTSGATDRASSHARAEWPGPLARDALGAGCPDCWRVPNGSHQPGTIPSRFPVRTVARGYAPQMGLTAGESVVPTVPPSPCCAMSTHSTVTRDRLASWPRSPDEDETMKRTRYRPTASHMGGPPIPLDHAIPTGASEGWPNRRRLRDGVQKGLRTKGRMTGQDSTAGRTRRFCEKKGRTSRPSGRSFRAFSDSCGDARRVPVGCSGREGVRRSCSRRPCACRSRREGVGTPVSCWRCSHCPKFGRRCGLSRMLRRARLDP